MTDTPRLDMTLVEGSDTLSGSSPSTALQGKLNDWASKLDSSVGRIICTSTTRPTTGLFPGIQAYETDTKRSIINPTGVNASAAWRYEYYEASGAGAVRSYRPIRPYGGDSAHSAFPTVVVLPAGKIVMFYRGGTNHTGIYDGAILRSESLNRGKTWSAAAVVVSGGTGVDLRDPGASLTRDGNTMLLTYFKATASNPGAGVYFRTSTDEGNTWSGEVRVENLTARSASSAPAVDLSGGTIVVPFYGRNTGETWESVWTAKSTDGGASWASPVRLINGETAGDHRQEPYITMNGTSGMLTYRHGNASQIGSAFTSDNTVNWSGGTPRFAGSGRPATCVINDNTFTCVYRSVTNGDALIRTTRDNGASWTPPRLVEPAWNSGGWMTYAAMDKIDGSTAIMVMGNEAASTQSRIFISYVGEAGAVTPFGALPSQQDMVWNNEDNQIFATNFEQTNGNLVYPWYVISGAATVIDGEVRSSSADNVPDFCAMYTGTNDMEVEAEINCGGSGTIQSGAGIIFRMISATTYLIFTVEGQGVNYRLYKVVSGVATLLERNGDSPGAPFDYNVGVRTLPFNQFVKYKVICRERYIWVYLNDQWIVASSGAGQTFPSAMLSAADYSTFSGGRFAGFKLNDQSTTIHRCRRFSVRG